MPETRRKYDPEFKEGAVRIVRETGKPIAQIARDLGVHEGTLANWVGRVVRAADAHVHVGTEAPAADREALGAALDRRSVEARRRLVLRRDRTDFP